MRSITSLNTKTARPANTVSDEPEDDRSYVKVHVGHKGIMLCVGALPFTPTMTPEGALGLAERLKESAALFERHYRAFVHDETDTVH